jgi:hypothetical protein
MPTKIATAKTVGVKAVKPKTAKTVKKPTLKTYTVRYSLSLDELIEVEVKAPNKDEAGEKAREKLMRDWELNGELIRLNHGNETGDGAATVWAVAKLPFPSSYTLPFQYARKVDVLAIHSQTETPDYSRNDTFLQRG